MSAAEEFATLSEEYNAGDMAWIAACTIFAWGIIPGLGLLYSGYSNRKNALSPIWTNLMAMGVGSISWMLMGYGLAYGPGNAFIGDSTGFGHAGIMAAPVGAIPELLFSIYQLCFANITIAIFLGGAAERARLSCIPVIVFIWPLIVYCPIAHWTWNATGWLYELGAYDFAGGSPVHIASGMGSLAFATYLSKPLFRSKKFVARSVEVYTEHRPHNLFQLFMAYIFIAAGWLAFDGGSTLALNLRSFVAMNTTQVSGAMGGIVWSLLEYLYTEKWSMNAFVTGTIAGLVAITPGCGFVGLPASLLFGAVGAVACFYTARFKFTSLAKRIKFSDPCDVFACHACGGIVGGLLTGIFAQTSIAATDGVSDIAGGWLDGHWRQLGIQLADVVATAAYAFVVTYLLIALIDCVPGLEVLATEEDIVTGIDISQNGESFGEYQWRGEDEKAPFIKGDLSSQRTRFSEEGHEEKKATRGSGRVEQVV